ncbi:MAG: anion permease, partial [Pseudomonadales bacterium]|nr:anion permease [Pseudomonadales bacterium]
AILVLSAIALITGRVPFGGWENLFDLSGTKDYMVAFASVICMFLIPNGKGGKLLDWDSAAKIEWGMLILFGAGLSIAAAFSSTGLSTAIGETLAAIAKWDIFFILLTLCLAVTFLTEMTSNTATTSLLMPILAVTAVAASIDPKLLMIPAAMSASCAFMLPVATAPNVVVFSTGKFGIERMIREGFALNIIGALVISTLSYFLLT